MTAASAPDQMGDVVRPSQLVNLTPHAIAVALPSGRQVHVAPSGTIARVEVARTGAPPVIVEGEAVDRSLLSFGGARGLPDPRQGSYFVVSLPVALAVQRADLLVVDEVVRGRDGLVTACCSFGTVT